MDLEVEIVEICTLISSASMLVLVTRNVRSSSDRVPLLDLPPIFSVQLVRVYL